jgi:hypothetical protein
MQASQFLRVLSSRAVGEVVAGTAPPPQAAQVVATADGEVVPGGHGAPSAEDFAADGALTLKLTE